MSFKRLPHAVALAGAYAFAGVAIATPLPYYHAPAGIQSLQSSASGMDIGILLGADRFYDAGYTGSSAIVTNVEAGHIWNGHSSLDHVNTFIHANGSASGFGTNNLAYDRHATWVGSMIGGRANAPSVPDVRERGIAYGTELWSGAIATTWTPPAYSLAFSFTGSTYLDPYQTAVRGDSRTGGRTTDVVTSSWNASVLSDGFDFLSVSLDALAAESGATFTLSAGNGGPGSDTVTTPASGYNAITVGALAINNDSIAAFSSRGPSPIQIPGGSLIPNARATVDLVAPGQGLIAAYYGGQTGGNDASLTGSTPDNGTPTSYTGGLAGTSFSTPIVAGGAALVIDAARQNGMTNATDARVVKAILQNSADKLPGWDNGQNSYVSGNGIITTAQGLDYASGAGRLNLASAYDQLFAGTTDVAGLASGDLGAVAVSGWDFGRVVSGVANEYYLANALQAGTVLSVTLDWFVDAAMNAANQAALLGFDDLSLEVWKTNAGSATELIALSDVAYNNVEHLFFEVGETANYMLRVLWEGEVWPDTDLDQTLYGLAWSGTATIVVPPGNASNVPTWALLLVGMVLIGQRVIEVKDQSDRQAGCGR